MEKITDVTEWEKIQDSHQDEDRQRPIYDFFFKKKNGWYRNRFLVVGSVIVIIALASALYIGVTEGIPNIIHNGQCLNGDWSQPTYQGLSC